MTKYQYPDYIKNSQKQKGRETIIEHLVKGFNNSHKQKLKWSIT